MLRIDFFFFFFEDIYGFLWINEDLPTAFSVPWSSFWLKRSNENINSPSAIDHYDLKCINGEKSSYHAKKKKKNNNNNKTGKRYCVFAYLN